MKSRNQSASSVDWIRPNLERDKLVTLGRRSYLRPTADLVVRTVVQVAAVMAALVLLSSGNWIPGLVIAWMSCAIWSFMGYGGLGHELFHGTVFPSKKLNRSLFVVLSLLTWNNFAYFDYSHRVHHKITLFDGDPEGNAEPLRLSDVPWLLTVDFPSLARRISILTRNSFGVVPEPVDCPVPMSSHQRRKVVNAARLLLAFQAALILLFVLVSQFWLVLLVTLAPFTATLFSRSLETIQHSGMRKNTPDFRQNTRSVRVGHLWRFVYANMNFHTEHHIYPAIPYYKLRSLSGELERTGFVTTPARMTTARFVSTAFASSAKSPI